VYSPHAAGTLEELLNNPNCTIRHVKACSSDSPTISQIANVFQRLTLSTLYLVYVDQKTPQLPSIVRLYMDFRRANKVVKMADPFTAFPNIRELCMENFVGVSLSPRDRGCILCPRQLRSLQFSNCDMGPLLRMFIEEQIVATNLFSVKNLKGDDVAIVGEYFSMFGHALQEVRIGLFDIQVLGTDNVALRSVLKSIILFHQQRMVMMPG